MADITRMFLKLCNKLGGQSYGILWISVGLSAVWVLGALAYFILDIDRTSGLYSSRVLALILLLLPITKLLVLIPTTHGTLRGALALITLAAISSYVSAWLLYSFHFDVSWIVWGSFATLLVIAAFWVTWIIMRRPSAQSEKPEKQAAAQPNGLEKQTGHDLLDEFRTSVGEHTFLTTCFFLNLFICITLLLSFAFAFHDRHQRSAHNYGLCVSPAPARRNSNVNKKSEGPASTAMPPVVYHKYITPKTWQPKNKTNPPNPPQRIFFSSGSAGVETSGDGRVEPYTLHNDDAFRDLLQGIDKNKRYRLTLIGHTDKQDVESGNYKSNFELSEARALSTYLFLRRPERLGASIAEWRTVAAGSEGVFIHGPATVGTAKPRSVDIFLEVMEEAANPACLGSEINVAVSGQPSIESRRLPECNPYPDLNDYIYFTIYTITTTGYGDIRPVTPEAKFLASMTNLFELFFLVIFFNILISHKRPLDASGERLERMSKDLEEVRKKLSDL